MTTVYGLFGDSKMAGEAVANLKAKGYAKEISVLAHSDSYKDTKVHEVKQDASEGAAAGAGVGAAAGVLAGILSGITSVIVPGVGVLVGGPLVALLGLTGGAAGALGGGILGALVDLGFNEAAAGMYDTKIRAGNVLVSIATNDETADEVRAALAGFGASDIETIRT